MSIKEELSQSRREYLREKNIPPEAVVKFEEEVLEPLFRKCHQEFKSLKELYVTITRTDFTIRNERKPGTPPYMSDTYHIEYKYDAYEGDCEVKDKNKIKDNLLEFFYFNETRFLTANMLDAATEFSGDIKGRVAPHKMWVFSLSLDD